MGGKSDKPLFVDGKRIDGRKPDEFRPIKMEVGILDRADGSARVELGKTKVIAGVYGPREMHPRHDTMPNKAVVRCRYDMMSFSVEERARPGRSRRSTEITKVLSEALESVVYTERFPGMAIDVFVQVYQADASTRVVALNAASLALANAGIPMKDLVTACSFGKSQGVEKGKPVEVMVLDVAKEEDNVGLADVAMAVLPNSGKVVLLQMDGDLSPSEFKQGMGMGMKMCESLYEEQKKALKEGIDK